MAAAGAPAPRWEVCAEPVPPQLDSTVSGVCGSVGKFAGVSLDAGVTESVAPAGAARAIGAGAGAARLATGAPARGTVSAAAGTAGA